MVAIFIITEVRLYRDGLTRVLDGDSRVHVLGAAGACDDAIATIRTLDPPPRVVLMDVSIPEALRGLGALQAELPSTPVIAFAVADVERDVIALAEAGVAGFVSPAATLDELVETVLTAARDEAQFSPRTAATLLRRVASLARERSPHPGTSEVLTAREHEIMRLIGDGLSNKEIAGRLCIEVPTVKNHVHHILQKLHVSRRGEAVAIVRRDAAGMH